MKEIGVFENAAIKNSIIQAMFGLVNSLLNICYLLEDIKKTSCDIAMYIDYSINDFIKFLNIVFRMFF